MKSIKLILIIIILLIQYSCGGGGDSGKSSSNKPTVNDGGVTTGKSINISNGSAITSGASAITF